MKAIIIILLVLINTACASKDPFEMAKTGPTMKQSYENHLLGDVVLATEVTGNSLISRSLENYINYNSIDEYAYKRLQNPELEMFIYPHRSTRHGVVVPGYTIKFPMYERVQYGLVGDVANAE